MISTRITDLLGSRYPILSGGMGSGVASPNLVATIAEAGAFPVLGTATLTISEIRAAIADVQERTSKPFGVNVLLIPGSYPDATVSQVIAEVRAAGVRVIETAGRSPRDYVGEIHDAGIAVIHKAARVRDVVSAERAGADAVAILGYEAAGHISAVYVSELVQLQATVAQVTVPVVAAGGFTNGASVLAALALGAEGVLMGTRFALTEESPLHPDTKAALLRADVTDTEILARDTGDDVRVLATRAARELAERERAENLDYPSLKALMKVGKDASLFQGITDSGTFPVGQAVGLIDDIPTTDELVRRIVSEIGSTFERLAGIVNREPAGAAKEA